MKITTAGLPSSESELTSLPETVSGRLKLGRGVPSSRILEGVRAIATPYPGGGEPATQRTAAVRRRSVADELRQDQRRVPSAFVVNDGVHGRAAEHTLDVAARFDVGNELDPKIEARTRTSLAPALRGAGT